MEKLDELEKKVRIATKWSALTEIIAKLVNPITNIILVRILAPEAFGVVTMITMIMSFADMFTDAGFQKYLVQKEFKSEKEKNRNINVAFWTNFILSICFMILMMIFSKHIARLVGNKGLGKVVSVASIQLLMTSFSSIQMALFRRDFDFKTLFLVRIFGIFIPFFITIPLALLGFSYWSLIIGMLFLQFFNALILTIKSKWKPKLYYDFNILKKMISFSMWSLIEAISIWFTTWTDAFIVASFLNQYYLGLYKTSTSMVNMFIGLISASIIPIFFSTLSRLQNDDNKFKTCFLNTQRKASILLIPLGVGIYLFSDLATTILLGDQWREANKVIGHWAITSVLMIVFGHFCSEAYRAKGLPKLSFLAQVLHLVVLIPACFYSVKNGFWIFIYVRSWIRMEFVLIHFILMQIILKISFKEIMKNIFPIIISSLTMGIIGIFIRQIYRNIFWDIFSILICILVYFSTLFLFINIREEIINELKKINLKSKKKKRKRFS